MLLMNHPVRYLVAGCGYVGLRLAVRLLSQGPVIALTRGAANVAALAARGLDAERWDLDAPDAPPPPSLARAAVLYYLIPPPPHGTTDTRLARALAALEVPPTRFVYISTTGVYGDAGGGIVDEDSPLNPTTERAQRRADAERQVRAWCEARGVPWTILRVPGIYGPGRLPLDRLRRSDPVIRHAEAGYSSRIHADDLAEACVLAGTLPAAAGRIYNVTDGNTATMTEYFERVATLAGLPPPPLVSRAEAARVLSPMLMSFLDESRRIDSSRIRRELGFEPRYADLRLGILSSLG
jgi:nucleoside-diphosphate-sugar epimerase